MCGRFTLTIDDVEQLAALLGVEVEPAQVERYRPRFNVAPTDEHWIVRAGARERLLPASWGVGANRQILTRVENARSRTMLADPAAGHRCVVAADGFFEWTGEKGHRRPVWFHRPDAGPGAESDRLVLLGALCTESKDGFRFSILTTPANEVVAPVHDRMPVVIPTAALGAWLTTTDPKALASMLRPAPAASLIGTEVDVRVNVVGNDDPACLAPPAPVSVAAAAAKRRGQLRLF